MCYTLLYKGGQKTMKDYIRPTMQGEVFATNEYVTACYLLACHRGSDGKRYPDRYWGSGERGDVSHSILGTANTCADSHANRVITSDGGIFSSVGEYNGEQGWLKGGIDKIIQNDGNNTIDPGDIILWHTVASGFGDNRKWNHWGVVEQQDPNHPNHS